MSFKSVGGDMKGLVGESHENFEKVASQREIVATKAASRARKAEEKGKGEERQQELEMELGIDGQVRAKYKIEVTFGPQRTTNGPNMVGIIVWESGKHFHGGGDEMAYFCKDNREGHDEGCWSVISGSNIKSGMAFCPNCQRMVNVELLTNQKIGRVSTRNLVKDLEKLFRQLGSNADIYVKYHYDDPRYRAMAKEKGEKVARRLKGMHIYPLKNILRDTSNGASIDNRFFAFLTA